MACQVLEKVFGILACLFFNCQNQNNVFILLPNTTTDFHLQLFFKIRSNKSIEGTAVALSCGTLLCFNTSTEKCRARGTSFIGCSRDGCKPPGQGPGTSPVAAQTIPPWVVMFPLSLASALTSQVYLFYIHFLSNITAALKPFSSTLPHVQETVPVKTGPASNGPWKQ